MRPLLCAVLFLSIASPALAPRAQRRAAAAAPAADTQGDPIAVMVGRLDLEKYKATIKGLTQFGDRRQGTDRNRAAIDWIEAQLKSYGCTNGTLRLRLRRISAHRAGLPSGPPIARQRPDAAPGGGRLRGTARRHRSQHRSECAAR